MSSYEKTRFKVVRIYCITCKPCKNKLKNINGIKKIDITLHD